MRKEEREERREVEVNERMRGVTCSLPSRQPQGPSHVRVNATGPGSVFSLITGA
jgi:hypothetical protein